MDWISKEVEAARQELPFKPLESLKEIKEYPNNIVLSYVIQGLDTSINDLKYLFSNLKELSQYMELYAKNTPQLGPQFINFYESKPEFVIAGEKAIISNNTQENVKIELLTNEISSGVSAFTGGYLHQDKIIVRDIARKAANAYFLVVKNQLPEQFQELSDYPNKFIDIVAAHELGHRGNQDQYANTNEIELAAEKEAYNIMKNKGDEIYYQLHHHLRSNINNKGQKNISQLVLEQNKFTF